MRMIQGGNRPSLLLSRRAPNSPIQRAVCPSGGTPAAARRCLARRERLGLCRSPDARSSSPRCRPASSRSRPIRPLQPRSQLLAASWRCLRPTSCRIAFVSPNREPRTLPGPSQNDPDHTYSLLIDAWLRGKPPAYLDILYPLGLPWVNWTPSSPTSVLVSPRPVIRAEPPRHGVRCDRRVTGSIRLLDGRAVCDSYRQLSVALSGRLRSAIILADSTISFKSFQSRTTPPESVVHRWGAFRAGRKRRFHRLRPAAELRR